jgi:hypothetical protein
MDKAEILRTVMVETRTSQTVLSRLSGMRQPSISQFLSGRIDVSDEQLDRLLSCMGRHLVVERHAEDASLTRSEHRSWLLHRALAHRFESRTYAEWKQIALRNLERIRDGVSGEPHNRNVERWQAMLADDDTRAVRRTLTGLDRESIELREVSPLGGILTDDERRAVLAQAA